jgi:hypothetical protein
MIALSLPVAAVVQVMHAAQVMKMAVTAVILLAEMEMIVLITYIQPVVAAQLNIPAEQAQVAAVWPAVLDMVAQDM